MNNEVKIKNEFVGDPIVDSGLLAINLLANKGIMTGSCV